MYNLGIIGVGALGKRHLQSMVELQKVYNFYAVEKNHEVVQIIKGEFPQVNIVSSIGELPNQMEVVVIATNSDVRRQVFEELIYNRSISNVIFEKVLFQKEEDYYFVRDKLRDRNIHAWVNCARREWGAYKDLKKEIDKSEELHVYAVGGAWGLGTSGIHILDLIEYLSGDEVEEIKIDKLEKSIEPSKRKGFYEFYGTIAGRAGKCKNFNITCIKDSSLPFRIEIITESKMYIVEEANNTILESSCDFKWEWNRKEFKQVYQSQLTGTVIDSIVKSGSCNLSDYESSMKLHLKLIRQLMNYFKSNGWEEESCPIT